MNLQEHKKLIEKFFSDLTQDELSIMLKKAGIDEIKPSSDENMEIYSSCENSYKKTDDYFMTSLLSSKFENPEIFIGAA